MTRFSRTLLFLFLACGFLLLPAQVAAQQAKPAQQQQIHNQEDNQQQDQMEDQSQDLQTSDVCPFTGTISKKEGKFYLEDHSHRQTYLLDDSWLARRHVGVNVLVHGTLNQEKNLIRVRSIVNVRSTTFPRCDSLLMNPKESTPSGIAT
ncbi:MAG TPA: DUF5818 domain-containing protein [Candidatus Acidoferrum sp.]|nr:DUF5818 domain-containing protein [Candidatus Acidoferrum sp.]